MNTKQHCMHYSSFGASVLLWRFYPKSDHPVYTLPSLPSHAAETDITQYIYAHTVHATVLFDVV